VSGSVRAAPAGAAPAPLLAAEGVVKDYVLPKGKLRGPAPVVHALRGVSLTVSPGERVGVVGESGSGKTTLAKLLVGLEQPTAGTVRFDGEVVSGRAEREIRALRRGVQMVFQDPRGSLDPRMRVGAIVAEPLAGLGIPGRHEERVAELLDAVGLPPEAARRYPHQFSGGQRQRIAVARALAPSPRVLLADEPVSALDVSVRAQVLNLLLDLVQEFRLALVFVSHDLSVVRFLCDRVVVLHRGEVVEEGLTEQVWTQPQAAYTRSLLAAIPRVGSPLPQPPPGF
jgi:ABC-type glutathione transport system ATPase component